MRRPFRECVLPWVLVCAALTAATASRARAAGSIMFVADTLAVTPLARPHALDFDGDGRVDLAGGHWANVYPATGAGTFAGPIVTPVDAGTSDIAYGDVTGDGRPDAVVGVIWKRDYPWGPGGVVLVYPGRGDGGFDVGPVYDDLAVVAGVTLGDVDGDHVDDVLVTRTGPYPYPRDHLTIFMGEGASRLDLSPGVIASGPRAADLNRDGLPDLVLGTLDEIVVYLATAPGVFAPPQRIPVGAAWTLRQIVDVDDDGILDLLATRVVTLVVYRGLGDGRFTEPIPLLDEPVDKALLLDFNGDGRRDLLHAFDDAMGVRVGLGDMRFGPAQRGVTGVLDERAWGDVNGDGRPDLLRVANGRLGLLRNVTNDSADTVIVRSFRVQGQVGDVILSWAFDQLPVGASAAIDRAATREGPWVEIDRRSGSDFGVVHDEGLPRGEVAWYRLRVPLAAGDRLFGPLRWRTPPALSLSTFQLLDTPDAVEVAWRTSNPRDVSSIGAEGGFSPAGPFAPLPQQPVGRDTLIAVLDPQVPAGTERSYRLRAQMRAPEIQLSPTLSLVVQRGLALDVFNARELLDGVELEWNVSDPEPGATYQVERLDHRITVFRRISGEITPRAGASVFVDTSAVPGQTMRYRVRATVTPGVDRSSREVSLVPEGILDLRRLEAVPTPTGIDVVWRLGPRQASRPVFVERSRAESTSFAPVPGPIESRDSSVALLDTTALAGVRYAYRVSVELALGVWRSSETVVARFPGRVTLNDLSARETDAGIEVSWTSPASPAAIDLERSAQERGPYASVGAPLQMVGTRHGVLDPDWGPAPRFYRVVFEPDSGVARYARPILVTPRGAVVLATFELRRVAGGVEARWSYSGVARPSAAIVERRRFAQTPWAAVPTTVTREDSEWVALDATVEPDREYTYRLRIVSFAGESQLSAESSIRTSPPLTLDAFAVSSRRDGIEVSWRPGAGREWAGYRIERRDVAIGPWTPRELPTHEREDGTSWVLDDDVVAGHVYRYRIVAVSPDGWWQEFPESPSTSMLVVAALDWELSLGPNPFTDVLTATFSTPIAARARLELFDVNGRHVTTLFDRTLEPGRYVESWRVELQASATGAMYFVRFRAGERTLVRRVTRVR